MREQERLLRRRGVCKVKGGAQICNHLHWAYYGLLGDGWASLQYILHDMKAVVPIYNVKVEMAHAYVNIQT
jgi:hypothetical protein